MKTAILHLACLCLLVSQPLRAADLQLDESIRDIVPAGQVKNLGSAEQTILAILAKHANSSDAETARAASEIQTLLKAPRIEMASRDKLAGKWKVRSLQLTDGGLSTYPYFDCSLTAEAVTGLKLSKNTGSQRRAGNLFKHDKTALLFLGGSYYSDQSPRGFSGLQDESVKLDPSLDSIGFLHQLAPGHLIILFASTQYGGEIYELKRNGK